MEPEEEKLALQEMRRIPGVGTVIARKLVTAGCRTLDDVRSSPLRRTLRPGILKYLDYVEYLEQPVTRKQAEDVKVAMVEALSQKFDVMLVGDFRRGWPTSSSIDILLTHPQFVYTPIPPNANTALALDTNLTKSVKRTHTRKQPATNAQARQEAFLETNVVEPLKNNWLAVETLTSTMRTWSGIVEVPHRLDKEYCRLSITLAMEKTKGAALLSLTGDRHFCNDLARRAQRMGLALNEHGLWRAESPSDSTPPTDDKADKSGRRMDQSNTSWVFVEGDSEEDILDSLGMDFIEPEKRHFAAFARR